LTLDDAVNDDLGSGRHLYRRTSGKNCTTHDDLAPGDGAFSYDPSASISSLIHCAMPPITPPEALIDRAVLPVENGPSD
jgi:hypothetical protein